MKTTRKTVRACMCVLLFSVGGLLAGAGTSTAAPGDPTAEECAVLAQIAVANSTNLATEVAKAGGGTCPEVQGVTVAPAKSAAVLAAAVTKATLPKSGGNVTGSLVLASVSCVVGGALILINRKRKTPTPA